ncbi:hypothetical protein VTL71DRAFT_13099 [Oculimacula yallundae]|uniref:Uncharacterized protein n=1 Tax=Oculimacula yallundae TaxID=86028 RepID=A0ABR4CPV6_9HELO
MQFFALTALLVTLTLSTPILASPTPYITKVDSPSGRPKYVCVDSDLSCLTKRAVAGVGGFVGYAVSEITHGVSHVIVKE